ncbi:hypothetical protein J6590_035203 [Homalodisca vitripennis]|nr:hypothetical protein J6590_035203 [Homalodisca vitripennis]
MTALQKPGTTDTMTVACKGSCHAPPESSPLVVMSTLQTKRRKKLTYHEDHDPSVETLLLLLQELLCSEEKARLSTEYGGSGSYYALPVAADIVIITADGGMTNHGSRVQIVVQIH